MRAPEPPIDWDAPWYQPWRTAADKPAPVRFVPQSALPGGVPYEQFIHDTGQVPVREGLHDFFNALCWRQFPLTKRQLNRLQAAEIARSGIGGRRGPLRDAITIFDENGALLHAPDELWQALVAREWRRAFVDLRPLWEKAQLTIFGHALLEKLAHPRKDLTAHLLLPNAPLEELDGWLQRQTTAELLASKPFTPLPVLGVPGWWAGNADFSFYDDPLVFRPRRA